ncbi:hypothetical protein BDK92_6412 [Micromonospora pisi]|uniref:Uncharacterized protein n=1 Tax=Micromonospora pisi TaxID=589240 RepID=A0A495JT11_9ACTN|nr:hypothetical protein BDK92_6412 [Micromonospora pisi]
MTDDISQQPLARAVLKALTRTRGANDPLGSLARSVLGGEVNLRAAAGHSWYGQALGDAFAESLAQRDDLAPAERVEIDRQAGRLRDAGEQSRVDGDSTSGSVPSEDSAR